MKVLEVCAVSFTYDRFVAPIVCSLREDSHVVYTCFHDKNCRYFAKTSSSSISPSCVLLGLYCWSSVFMFIPFFVTWKIWCCSCTYSFRFLSCQICLLSYLNASYLPLSWIPFLSLSIAHLFGFCTVLLFFYFTTFVLFASWKIIAWLKVFQVTNAFSRQWCRSQLIFL